MNRDDLLSLCDRFATHRRQLHFGRLSVDLIGPPGDLVPPRDPVPEIIRSFREAEISESEKNALLSLVCEDEEEATFCDEAVCITDPYADELAAAGDDDEA
jgi:hypothetical protein